MSERDHGQKKQGKMFANVGNNPSIDILEFELARYYNGEMQAQEVLDIAYPSNIEPLLNLIYKTLVTLGNEG